MNLQLVVEEDIKMSRMLMIATIRDNKDNIVRLRLLGIDDNGDTTVREEDAAKVKAVLQRKLINIENLQLGANGEIEGSNGSIERYTKISAINGQIIGKEAPLVITCAIDDRGFEGYTHEGNFFRAVNEEVMKRGVANGCIKEVNGKRIVASIRGTYPEKTIESIQKAITKKTEAVAKQAGEPEQRVAAKNEVSKKAEVKQPEKIETKMPSMGTVSKMIPVETAISDIYKALDNGFKPKGAKSVFAARLVKTLYENKEKPTLDRVTRMIEPLYNEIKPGFIIDKSGLTVSESVSKPVEASKEDIKSQELRNNSTEKDMSTGNNNVVTVEEALKDIKANASKLISDKDKKRFDVATSIKIAERATEKNNFTVTQRQFTMVIEPAYKIMRPNVKIDFDAKSLDGDMQDIMNKIKALRTVSGFEKDFASKVCDTVEKQNRCTEKQASIINKKYDEIFNKKAVTKQVGAGNTGLGQKELIDETEKAKELVMSGTLEVPSNKTSNSEEKSDADDITKLKHNPSAYKLKVERFKAGLYVVGIEPSNYAGIVDIPATLGAEPIVGIYPESFKESSIRAIRALANITDIGYGAFKGSKVEIVSLKNSNIKFIARETFMGCDRLKMIDLNVGIEKIHEAAFAGCDLLESIELPESLEDIAGRAFFGCHKLNNIKHFGNIKRMNQSSFAECTALFEFDFNGVQSVGADAFKYCAFEKIVLPGTVREVGNRAFMGCYNLTRVDILEGVDSCGERCFCKPNESKIHDRIMGALGTNKVEVENRKLVISTPKSLLNIGNNCFDDVDTLEIFHGTVSENYATAFKVKVEYKDKLDRTNATNIRLKAPILAMDIVERLKSSLSEVKVGASMTREELKTLPINIPIIPELAAALGLPSKEALELKEKNCNDIDDRVDDNELSAEAIKEVGEYIPAKFVGAVNYLLSVSTLYVTPLKSQTMRLAPTIDIETDVVYTHGEYQIYKIKFTVKDMQESGSFIMVVMNNCVRYMTEVNVKTDIKMDSFESRNEELPIAFLHTGDCIGRAFSIGASTAGEDRGKQEVGEKLLNRLQRHGIEIREDIKNKYLYIPASKQCLHLIDDRKYDADGLVSKKTPDHLKIKNIYTTEEFVNKIIKVNKAVKSDREFFDDLFNASDSYVQYRNKMISVVPEEKIGQLFKVCCDFRELLTANGGKFTGPRQLNTKVLEGILDSYFTVRKDKDWFNGAGSKSLNKTDEFVLSDGTTVREFRSNQVIKFMNPYMRGCKGAYVFTTLKNGITTGVYASTMNLAKIVKALYVMSDLSELKSMPAIMQDPMKVDKLDAKMFFDFYDLLFSKGGWSSRTFAETRNLNYDGFYFKLSMYKPTGVFYVIAKTFNKRKTDKETVNVDMVAFPLFRVGDMDRALLVAATTNHKAKQSKLMDLLKAIVGNLCKSGSYWRTLDNDTSEIGNFYEARKMLDAGEANAFKYLPLIGNRLTYMVGLKAKGEIGVAEANEFYNSMNDTGNIYMSDIYGDEEEILDDEDEEEETIDTSDMYDEEDGEILEDEEGSNNITDSIYEEEEEFEEDEEYEEEDGGSTEDEEAEIIRKISSMSEEQLREEYERVFGKKKQ